MREGGAAAGAGVVAAGAASVVGGGSAREAGGAGVREACGAGAGAAVVADAVSTVVSGAAVVAVVSGGVVVVGSVSTGTSDADGTSVESDARLLCAAESVLPPHEDATRAIVTSAAGKVVRMLRFTSPT